MQLPAIAPVRQRRPRALRSALTSLWPVYASKTLRVTLQGVYVDRREHNDLFMNQTANGEDPPHPFSPCDRGSSAARAPCAQGPHRTEDLDDRRCGAGGDFTRTSAPR